jgi:MFS family permease
MYHSKTNLDPALRMRNAGELAKAKIGLTVYLLGVTSMLTDVSAEMVASVLPVYLFSVLRLSPFEFGVVDGIYNGSTAIIRIFAGYASDSSRRHKTIAFAGYALSAISKCGLLLLGLGGWLPIAGVLLLDRLGKGIRTAPRDALIAESTAPDMLATAFGIHRALDTVGAMIGPLLATGILLWLPRRFDSVFMLSICFAVFGLLIIGLYVHPPKETKTRAALDAEERITVRAALRILEAPRFLLLMAASVGLSLFTLSDNMIYLGLQKRIGFDAAYLPLLFVATASVFMAFAVPFGKLADRFGAMKIFLGGHLMLAAAYALFALSPDLGAWSIAVYVSLMGSYYAATDGIVAALAVEQLPAAARASGLACITSAISIARMGSSILFGWLWDKLGQKEAVGCFGTALLVVLVIAAVLVARPHRSAARSSR